jgi:hypothetical protein
MTNWIRRTKKQVLAEAVERVLQSCPEGMHYTELSKAVSAIVGGQVEPAARLNGMLHDEGSGRFCRTGRGVWALAPAAASASTREKIFH